MSSWRNQLISQWVNSRSLYLHLCFGADVLLQQLGDYGYPISTQRCHNLLQNSQVSSSRFNLHVREFGVINQSAQFWRVGQQHLLSSKWSICNSYNTKFYCHLHKSRSFASIFVIHTPAPRKLLEHGFLLNSLMDYCYWHHHQHIYFIGPDVSAVAKEWLCPRRVVGCFCHHRLSSPTCYFVFTVGLLCNCR